MNNYQFHWWRPVAKCVLLGLLLSFSSGCVFVTYSQHVVQLRVHDIDTGEPIAETPIRVFYYCGPVLNAPEPVEGITDENGEVDLVLADPKACSICARVGGPQKTHRDFTLRRDLIRGGGMAYPNSGDLNVMLELVVKR